MHFCGSVRKPVVYKLVYMMSQFILNEVKNLNTSAL